MTDEEMKKFMNLLEKAVQSGVKNAYDDKLDESLKPDRFGRLGEKEQKERAEAIERFSKIGASDRRRDEIGRVVEQKNTIQAAIDRGEYNKRWEKRLATKEVKKLENREKVLRNGFDAKEARMQQAQKAQAKFGSVIQILNAGLDIFVATQERLIELKKAEVEKNVKLTQLGLKRQSLVMTTGMKGITDGFNKNAHEMAYNMTQSGYDIAKTMMETSMQMTIAGKVYAKDVLAANTKSMGSIIAATAAIGTAVGALIGGIGAPIGAAVGAAIGFVAASWNKIWGLDIQRRQLDIQIMEQVTSTMGQYQDTFKQLASGWDELYKSTSDMVLKINDAGIKFGTTIGFGSDKFANTMLRLANTRVSGNKSLARIFGDEVDKIPEYMSNYMEASQRNVGLNATDLGNIMGTSRLFGMSGSESANLYGAMNIFNTSVSSASDSMGIMYHQITRMGLSSKKFGKDLVQNLKLAEKYNFKGGVENMMKMTKWAQQTRFNLNNATSFAEKLTTGSLSEVLESSAKLQVLGGSAGIYSDPLAMMYEAGADVGALAKRQAAMFNDITGTFNKKTGETEFNWYENRMLSARAQAMGMSVEDAKNMIRQSNKQGVIDKQLKGSGLSDEDRLAIGNRATYNKKNGRWEVTDIKGKTHDIEEYKNGKANIDDLLPADTQESILKVSEQSLSHLEELDNSTKAISVKLGVTEQDTIQTRADKERKTKEDFYTEHWGQALAAFEAAGQHSENMFNQQIEMMKKVSNNLDVLNNIYAGVERQVKDLLDKQFVDIKTAAAAFAESTEKFATYIGGLVDPSSVLSNEERKHTNKTWWRLDNSEWEEKDEKTGKRYKYRMVGSESGNRHAQQYINDKWVDEIEDGYVTPKGKSQDFVVKNGIRTNVAPEDTVWAARPDGDFNKGLNQLLSAVEMLTNNNQRNSFGNVGELKITFGGSVRVEQDGSITNINLNDIANANPSQTTQFVQSVLSIYEASKSGKHA